MSVLVSAMALCSPFVLVALIAGLVRLGEIVGACLRRIHEEEQRKAKARR